MSNEERAAAVKELADRLRALLPAHNGTIELRLCRWGEEPEGHSVELVFFSAANYAAGTEIMRAMGIGERKKEPWLCGSEAKTFLRGKTGDVEVQVHCAGLPESCRIEQFMEKVPKAQTLTTDEYVEVPRFKIVCGAPERSNESAEAIQ